MPTSHPPVLPPPARRWSSTTGIPADVAIRAASILVIMPPVPTAVPRVTMSMPARSASLHISLILRAPGLAGLVV